MVNIIKAAAFLNMSKENQLLYFNLALGTNEKDIVEYPEKVLNRLGLNEDNISILERNGLLIIEDNEITVIKNYNVCKRLKEIYKPGIKEDKEEKKIKKVPDKYLKIVSAWNDLGLSEVKSIQGTRLKYLNARIKEYSEEEIIKGIRSIRDSSFLMGQNKNNWTITFDWFIKPTNMPKVLEGNYIESKGSNINGRFTKYNFENFKGEGTKKEFSPEDGII